MFPLCPRSLQVSFVAPFLIPALLLFGSANNEHNAPNLKAAAAHGEARTFGRFNEFSQIPNQAYVGGDSFAYPALLPLLFSPSEKASGSPPVAQDDSYSVHGTTELGDFMANDFDPDGDPIYFESYGTRPQHGYLMDGAKSGTPFYVPNDAYVGFDSFTYRICDSAGDGCSAFATVTLTIHNEPPTAVNDSFQIHGQRELPNFLANDSDPDHDSIRFAGYVTRPQHGILIDGATLSTPFYDPNPSFVGTDSFSYTICDSYSLCSNATVTLNVANQAPTPGDDFFSITGTGSTELTDLLANDSDPDGDPIRFAGYVSRPQHGVLIDGAKLSTPFYAPNPGFIGTDHFVYTICDSLELCSNATVTLAVGGEPTPTPTPTPVPTATPTPTPPPPPPTPTPTPIEPLIFIPGIAGSELATTTGEVVWVGTNPFNKFKLSLAPGREFPIIATDALRNPLGTPVYGPILGMLAQAGYKEYVRPPFGCDLSQKHDDPTQNPTLFVFAYDWRRPISVVDQSQAQIVPQLADYVQCVRQFYPDSKVNILAHSMGGLVARRYIIEYPNFHNVNKLITIATPWLGAPKAMYTLETGKFFTNPFVKNSQQVGEFALDFLLSDTMKNVAQTLPGVHQLLPSHWYYDLGARPFAEGGWDINQNGKSREFYTPLQLKNLLNSRYPFTPGTTAEVFHQFAGQDDWRGDSSGVAYYHIMGEQKRNKTVGQIIAITRQECTWTGTVIPILNCVNRNVLVPEATNGDGTVPLLSARRVSGAVDLNSSRRRCIVHPGSPAADLAADHNGMTRFDPVWTQVLAWLSATPISTNCEPNPAILPDQTALRDSQNAAKSAAAVSSNAETTTTQDQSAGNLEPESAPFTHDQSYYINLIGTGDVKVTDAFGHTNTPIDDVLTEGVPGVVIEPMGDDSYQVITSTTDEYTITFHSNGTPFGIEIIKGETNSEPTKAIRYLDVSLPNNVTGRLKVTAQGIEDLRYDSDGDGVFETSVSPTAVVEGPAALDLDGPAITFAATPQQSSVLLSIAADDPSGLRQIYYSTDGTNYQKYTTPFLVSSAEASTVFVFADDNAGNRETASYDVPRPPSIAAPQDLTLNTGVGQATCGLTVPDAQLGDATATSNSSGSVAVTRSGVPSGNAFPVGTTSVTYTATDSNGLTASATQIVTVVDTTPPALSCPADIVVSLPIGSAADSMAVTYPTPSASDNCSGTTVTMSRASGSLFPLGTTSVIVTATDAAGNTTACSFNVTVAYRFAGFLAPVNNLPTINSMNAGRAIPIKFSLSGNKGLDIFAAAPGSGTIDCGGISEVELSNTLTAGGSSLSYDASSDQYTYVWKTDPAWAGSCRQLVIQLKDGTVHRLNFKLR